MPNLWRVAGRPGPHVRLPWHTTQDGSRANLCTCCVRARRGLLPEIAPCERSRKSVLWAGHV